MFRKQLLFLFFSFFSLSFVFAIANQKTLRDSIIVKKDSIIGTQTIAKKNVDIAKIVRRKDSIKRARFLKYKAYFFQNLQFISDSLKTIRKILSYNIRKQPYNILNWNKFSERLIVSNSHSFSMKTPVSKTDTLDFPLVKKSITKVYEKTVVDTIGTFFQSLVSNVFFPSLIILFFLFFINKTFYRKFSSELTGFYTKIILYPTRRFRDIPAKTFVKQTYFNSVYIITVTVATFYHFFKSNLIRSDHINVFFIVGYIFLFFLLSYVLKYIWISSTRFYVRHHTFLHYRYYNYYFNKSLSQIILPLLILLIFLRNKDYAPILLKTFDGVFFILLFLKFIFLLKIILNKIQTSRVFLFSVFYLIAEFSSIFFWFLVWIVPQYESLTSIAKQFMSNLIIT